MLKAKSKKGSEAASARAAAAQRAGPAPPQVQDANRALLEFKKGDRRAATQELDALLERAPSGAAFLARAKTHVSLGLDLGLKVSPAGGRPPAGQARRCWLRMLATLADGQQPRRWPLHCLRGVTLPPAPPPGERLEIPSCHLALVALACVPGAPPQRPPPAAAPPLCAARRRPLHRSARRQSSPHCTRRCGWRWRAPWHTARWPAPASLRCWPFAPRGAAARRASTRGRRCGGGCRWDGAAVWGRELQLPFGPKSRDVAGCFCCCMRLDLLRMRALSVSGAVSCPGCAARCTAQALLESSDAGGEWAPVSWEDVLQDR